MIQIMPLSQDNLKGALEVLDAEFGHEKDNADNYKIWLPNSLPDAGQEVADAWAKQDLQFLKYWVAVDLESKKVVGVTGIYTKSKQPDLAWLAWTSVQNGTPGLNGVENVLIDLSASVARSLGKESLADYCSDTEEDAGIRVLLSRHGFVVCKMDQESEAPDDATHYKLDLRLHF